ncbi:MAG: hypothetical protein ACP5M4_06970 [Acidobacteriaceae bacterium]
MDQSVPREIKTLFRNQRVALRERERRDTRGRKLMDVPGYTFRVLVTTRTDAEKEIWRE